MRFLCANFAHISLRLRLACNYMYQQILCLHGHSPLEQDALNELSKKVNFGSITDLDIDCIILPILTQTKVELGL
jgi:hypothetical protein